MRSFAIRLLACTLAVLLLTLGAEGQSTAAKPRVESSPKQASHPRVQLSNRGRVTALEASHELSSKPQLEEENDEEANEEDEKARLGIAISEEEASNTILRCESQEFLGMDAQDLNYPNVSVGIYLLNLDSHSGLTAGVFYADFLFYLRQHGGPIGGDPIKQLAFVNAKSINEINDHQDGIWEVSGNFFFAPDLRWYPFDSQTLDIVVEQMEQPVSEWVFVGDPNLNGLSPSIRFPGWLSSLRLKPTAHHPTCRTKGGYKIYPGAQGDGVDEALNVTYSRFQYKISVQRPILQGFLTHLVPALVVLMAPMYSYALEPVKDVATKLSINAAALVALILLYRGSTADIPVLGYLTAFDKFIFCCYLLVTIALFYAAGVYAFFRKMSRKVEMPDALLDELSLLSYWTMGTSLILIYLVFLPLWMLVDPTVMFPILILFLVLGVLLLFHIWGNIRDNYPVSELDRINQGGLGYR